MRQLLRHLLPILVFVALIPALTAQVDTIYQIRQNHKIGYIRIWDPEDPVILAKYDLISEDSVPWNWGDKTFKTSYRLFEQNGKVGLLNRDMGETLPARFKRIKPLTPNYFAVEEDSLFKLIRLLSDSNFEEVWPSEYYDDIQSFDHPLESLDPTYFKVKSGKAWGVHEIRGTLILTPLYDTLVYAGYPGYFKVADKIEGKSSSQDVLWKLIGPGNKPVYSEVFKNITVLGPKSYAVLRANEFLWKIWEELDTTTIYKELYKVNGFAPVMGRNEFNANALNQRFFLYRSITKLNSRVALLKSANAVGRDTIYDSKTGIIWDPINDVRRFKSLDEYYIRGENRNGGIMLVDMQGHVSSKPLLFDSIATTGIANYYFVFNRNKMGLISVKQQDTILLPCVYDNIYRLEGSHFLAKNSLGNYQLLTTTDSCVAISSGIFDNITLLPGDSIYGIASGVVFSLKMDVCKYVETPLADAGYTPKPVFVDAPGKEISKPSYNKLIKFSKAQSPINSFVSADKQVFLKYNKHKNLMLYSNNGTALDNQEFTEARFVCEESGKEILALYPVGQAVINDFAKCFTPNDGLLRVVFYDVAKRQFWFENDTIVGYRPFQSFFPFTTIVHANGYMCLIDRNGINRKSNDVPIKYSYIGNTIVKRIRFAKGGKMERLIANVNTEEDTYKIGEVDKVAAELNLKPANEKESISSYNFLRIGASNNMEARWGFLDENGSELFGPQFEFADDFNEKDKTAFIYRLNPNKSKTEDIYNVYYGAVNHVGTMFLPPKYNPINRMDGAFTGFYLIAKDSTYTFYFDNKGRTIFENPTKITPFNEGVAAFRNKEGRWGFVNNDGDTLVMPKYVQLWDSLRLFSEGLALVKNEIGTWVFVTSNDSILFYPGISKDSLSKSESEKIYFSDGRCPVKRGKKWGYMDRCGFDTIPAMYLHVTPFSHGTAWVVAVDKKLKKRFSYAINTCGDTLAGPYEDMREFNEYGLASFKENGRWGLVDSTGNPKVAAIYDSIYQFVNGYATVVNSQKKLGLLNTEGIPVLESRFVQIGLVSDAMVKTRDKINGEWTMWNLTKKPAIKIGAKFKDVTGFEGGVCVVQDSLVYNKNGELIYKASQNKKLILSEGIIHIKGSGVFQDGYGENIFVRKFSKIVTPFLDGIALVELDKGDTLNAAINKRGVIIVPPKYKKLAQNRDGNGITVNPNRLFGIADKDGNVIIEPQYDRIIYYPNYKKGMLFRVEHGEKIGYGVVSNKIWKWIRHPQY